MPLILKVIVVTRWAGLVNRSVANLNTQLSIPSTVNAEDKYMQ